MANPLDVAIDLIRSSIPNLISIYHFGSFGTEYETPQSDIDLAVLCTKPVNTVELWNISQKIASALGRDIDIVDLRQASTVFAFQIVTTGSRIYCSDESSSDAIENTYMSMYLRLNEERADIIKDRQNG